MVQCKHPAFQDEREVRFGMLNGLNNAEKLNKLQVFTNANKPFIKLDFNPKSVKKIVLGPGELTEEYVDKLKYLVASSIDYNHVEISRSRIPVIIYK